MELHEIESAILKAEADVIIANANYNAVKGKRDSLKDSVKEIRDTAATEMHELRKALELQLESIRARVEQETKDAEAEYAALSEPQWDAQRAKAKAATHLQDLQLMLDQARRANLKAAEFKTLEDRWDLMTMGAPWREWAKDHQIEGGKKATYEGRMILGDTMGLGKTLTSLIFIDMVEAATKDASDDNPINFGSMK